MRLATAALVAALLVLASAPASAQDCMGPNPSIGEQNRRALEERHRGFLSRLYGVSTLGAGPLVGNDVVLQSAAFEGGYQFDSGDAVAFVTSARASLFRDPVFGSTEPDPGGFALGAQYVVGLGRFAPASAVARRAEVGVGMATADYGGGGVTTVELSPRVVVPISTFLQVPLGLQISQPIAGDFGGAGTFVGLSLGLRSQYIPANRLVLDCDGFQGTSVPRR